MNKNEVKEALQVLIDNNLSKDDIGKIFEKLKNEQELNYQFKENEIFYWINNSGERISDNWKDDVQRVRGKQENYNAFPTHKKKQLEYLAKKQLLERKLFVYSDLHGAKNIDWQDSNTPKYYISCGVSSHGVHLSINTSYDNSFFTNIYFHTEEDAMKAMNENRDLIKEVLMMQRELYNK